jgi:hypothetical protein
MLLVNNPGRLYFEDIVLVLNDFLFDTGSSTIESHKTRDGKRVPAGCFTWTLVINVTNHRASINKIAISRSCFSLRDPIL